MKLLRLYRSDKGIWHYEIERHGKVYWSSLHTRDERVARAKYQQLSGVYGDDRVQPCRAVTKS